MVEFKLEKRKPLHEIPSENDEYELAVAFSKEVQKELGEFVKSIVLFGSYSRGNEKYETIHERDIDVLMIINDLTIILNPEVIQSYRVIVHNIASKHSKRLHITTMKLTNFWEYMRSGDPVAVNMLRDGLALSDSGIFEPMQHLLREGRIRPTREAVWTYFGRAPLTLKNSQWHILQAIVDLYWAVIDASHAILMHHGHVPPTPAHVADMMTQVLVKPGILPKKYADDMAAFYDISKKILHREVAWISGEEYDNYRKRAEIYVKGVEAVLGKNVQRKG